MGFDIISFTDCIEYYMELCLNYNPHLTNEYLIKKEKRSYANNAYGMVCKEPVSTVKLNWVMFEFTKLSVSNVQTD